MKKFLEIALFVFGLYGFIFSMLTFSSTIAVQIPIYVIIYIIAGISVIVVYIKYLCDENEHLRTSPHKYNVQYIEQEDNGADYIYIKRVEGLRYNVVTSVHYKPNKISKRVAVGIVSDPGTDNYTKIEVLKVYDSFQENYKKVIEEQNHRILSCLYVMPTAYIDDLGWLYYEQYKP